MSDSGEAEGGESNRSLGSIFQQKYTEFCDDLVRTYPEGTAQIQAARALTEAERMTRFRAEVLPSAGQPRRNAEHTPGTVLPGVTIQEEHWETFGKRSKKAIKEYITLLSFCCMFGDTEHPWAQDLSGNSASRTWMEQMMREWKDKLSSVDFKSLSEKMMNIFGGSGQFRLPERMLKGQLAKLAEELVREFKPEDFGLSADQLNDTGDDPSRAFQMLMDIYTRRPELLQNAMRRIGNRLQEKIRRGELRPQQLAAEAEEMMKEFTDNPAFVELMESFRSVFGMEDPDMARASGNMGSARLNIARQQMRRKYEAKYGRGGGPGGGGRGGGGAGGPGAGSKGGKGAGRGK